MGLKPWTMSFKETNPEEVMLHEILEKKTSPMSFAKDVLIEVLVRGNKVVPATNNKDILQNKGSYREEIEDIFDI